ncbi:hypothetical protein BDK92_5924 [Micromonospora pisi]|uniref:Uncharacterized protein n=1 Tax=Micromonospora pisi TaxID=589240 RepID=A0A495JRB9_9ACTN|nr:hypothetical protein [Micromonospora pisi]RKR91526.1 hypothetical protein BDK92_5924 [Micromonospora pisi]
MLSRRWSVWPWSGRTRPKPPPPPSPPRLSPPPTRPEWADERTANLRQVPLLTLGQQVGYRVARRNGGRHVR